MDLEKYPDSLSLVRKLDKITKLEACDISADDATIYPVGVFGFVIESPYFYSENSTDYIECRSNDPDSPKKGFKIELLSDALMGYNNMLTIKNLINKANAIYQDAKEKEYAVDGDTILAKQITSINNDGYFSSYIFKSIVEKWQEADTLQEKKQVEGMFRLLCGISLSEYLKNCIYETGEDTSYYREKESSVFIDPSVTDEMKNKLQHLEDIANEASDEIWDDDKENGRERHMNIVEKAIKNNEIKFLLEGTNGYKLENDSWASISAPIDWTRVVPLIYKQYEKSFDANIEKMFVKAIVDMLNGNAEEVYCGVAVLYFQILMEESSRAPFCVDRESLIKIASQTIRENEEQLKSIRKWGGQSSKNGLWDEIQCYKKLFISKFGIII